MLTDIPVRMYKWESKEEEGQRKEEVLQLWVK